MMSRRMVNVVTLGCSKNLVDSERLLKSLEDVGFDARHDLDSTEAKGSIVIVNTCGFIGDAKEESINTILHWGEQKKAGAISELYVTGCLSQRYRDELPQLIPEVDHWYGKTDWMEIIGMLSRKFPATASYDRVITTPRHHAYLKIAEGCNRFCAFCAIPLITGRYKSRPIEEIVAEVRLLVSRGVREFNVIAQDLSYYGTDIYGKQSIAELIDAIADIDGVEWIRLHYAYPSNFPFELLDVMARRKNVCKYLDIALQHISDVVLNNMRRHITSAEIRALLTEIRRRVPGITIRTTLMVGFPGEGESEFNELLEFVKEQKFERMGAFAYCEEEDTYATLHYNDNISEEEKKRRLDILMREQEKISMAHQEAKIGTTMRVIIDREEAEYYIARSEADSPEVDPEVLVKKPAKKLIRGNFYNVLIIQAMPFELIAEIKNDYDNNK